MDHVTPASLILVSVVLVTQVHVTFSVCQGVAPHPCKNPLDFQDVIVCINGECGARPTAESPQRIQVVCDCFPGWEGVHCDSCVQASVRTNHTSPPQSCMGQPVAMVQPSLCQGLTCVHGSCERVGRGSYVCACEAGWTGNQCDQCCDRPCMSGSCHVHRASSQMNCVCDDARYTADSNCTKQRTVHTDVAGEVFTLPTPVTRPDTCMGEPNPTVAIKPCHGLTCVYGECKNVSATGHRCDCWPGWTGNHCDLCCDLVCNRGTCYVDQTNFHKYCVCNDANYTEASNCTELHPTKAPVDKTPEWLWAVVGACTGALAVLIILLVVLPYCLWKKRYIFMLKIVHHFQKYDDPEKIFHVFISYKSTEEVWNFVSRLLRPKLAAMNLRVCVDYMNFLPGATIAENIICAVENSSRSILVISPEFCTAGWPRFEVQAAQREMMKLRHKIVPIMFKDITESRKCGQVDKVLSSLLDSHTYIKWPGTEDEKAEKRFWEHIRLAMPKVRPLEAPGMVTSPACITASGEVTSQHPVDISDVNFNNKRHESSSSHNSQFSVDSGVELHPGSPDSLHSGRHGPFPVDTRNGTASSTILGSSHTTIPHYIPCQGDIGRHIYTEMDSSAPTDWEAYGQPVLETVLETVDYVTPM